MKLKRLSIFFAGLLSLLLLLPPTSPAQGRPLTDKEKVFIAFGLLLMQEDLKAGHHVQDQERIFYPSELKRVNNACRAERKDIGQSIMVLTSRHKLSHAELTLLTSICDCLLYIRPINFKQEVLFYAVVPSIDAKTHKPSVQVIPFGEPIPRSLISTVIIRYLEEVRNEFQKNGASSRAKSDNETEI